MQRLEQQEEHSGYRPEEYREIVRRAERIRAEREDRLPRQVLADSAAELGIGEEELREAERQLEAERRRQAEQQAQRRSLIRTVSIAVASVLGLLLLFGYNSLNTQRLAVSQARSNLQTNLQRQADLLPEVRRAVEQGAARDATFAGQVEELQRRLQSGDLNQQLQANRELRSLPGALQGSGSTRLYQDLIVSIEGSANRVAVAQQKYDAAVTRYNETAQGFPINLVRPLLGFPGEIPHSGGRPPAP